MRGKTERRRPSPALVIAVLALIVALTGTAWAALGPNTVGSKQLKSKAVTTGKIANRAVTGRAVAGRTLTAEDIKVDELGVVPTVSQAQSAADATTVNGHTAACPSGSTLVRGICYDLALNSALNKGFSEALQACASRGGYLPSVAQLYSVRNTINLGSGIAPDYAVANEYYARPNNSNPSNIVVTGAGSVEEIDGDEPTKYICAYRLVR